MAEEEQGCLAGSGACALIAHQPLSYGQREAARGWLTTLFRVGMFLLGAIGIAGHADLAMGGWGGSVAPRWFCRVSRSESTRRYYEAEVPPCRDKKGDPVVAFSYAAILLLTQSTMAAIQPKMMSGML